MDQAYGAIEGRSVFLIAGMLPLGLALTKIGEAVATVIAPMAIQPTHQG